MIYISDTKLSMGSPWKKDPKVAGNTQSVIQSHCSTELLTSEAHIKSMEITGGTPLRVPDGSFVMIGSHTCRRIASMHSLRRQETVQNACVRP